MPQKHEYLSTDYYIKIKFIIYPHQTFQSFFLHLSYTKFVNLQLPSPPHSPIEQIPVEGSFSSIPFSETYKRIEDRKGRQSLKKKSEYRLP